MAGLTLGGIVSAGSDQVNARGRRLIERFSPPAIEPALMKTMKHPIAVWAGAGVVALMLWGGWPAVAAPANGLSLAKQLNEAFVSVAEKVSPSVVTIQVEGKAPSPEENFPFFDLLPPELRRQFEQYFERRREAPNSRRRAPAPTGQGSGIIISEDGFILTNTHVVEDAQKITVKLKSGKTYPATVQGVDPESDIAVIKIDAKGLPVARLGDSDKARVGEFVIAIGAPFSLDYTVTIGHISAKGRQVLDSRQLFDQDFIQTDASINPGNSGGPLVNLDGEVIGINTLIRGLNTGIGFAVPSNLAREVSAKLISEGRFTRAWLGIGIASLAEDAEYRELIKGIENGVVVRSIMPDGPAAKSSLEPGDVILAVDGKPVATAQELKAEIRVKKIDSPVTLDVYRDGRKIKVKVSPGALPEDQFAINRAARSPAATEALSFGLAVKTLTPQLARQYDISATEGVVITRVEPGSEAEAQGLQPGDLITRVNGRPVATAKAFTDALQAADPKRGVSLAVTGSSGRRLVILKAASE
jgi:Do/DeqQ family serine protease